jgi:glycosyltransferase involved in cell wall biosynthesis
MKILMLTGNEKEIGTYHRALNWATHLVHVGHHVTIACDGHQKLRTHSYYAGGIKIIETPSFMDGRWIGVRLAGMAGWGLLSIRARRAELLREKYDVVHSFEHYPSVVLPVYTAGQNKAPVFLSDWCDHYGEGGFRDTYSSFRLQAVYRPLGKVPRIVVDHLERDVRRRAAAITVASKYLFERTVNIGIDPTLISIVPGSVDTAKFRPLDKLTARDKLGLSRNRPIVSFLGTGQFDVDYALSAFVTVMREMPAARFLVLGKKVASLMQIANDLPLSGSVIFTGWCPHELLVNYLAATDVCVIPLRDNPTNQARWPGKIGEYMAMGLPTVCSRVSDVAELVEREKIGVVADNGPVQFGAAILALLKNGPLATEMGARARKVAERHFDVSVQGLQIERLYQVLLSKHATSSIDQPDLAATS